MFKALKKHFWFWVLGPTIGALIVVVVWATAASAQTIAPVEPDYWRGPRNSVCSNFNVALPQVCNTNPNGVSFRDSPDCRTYRENGNGTVTILCPEDHPSYYEMIRVADVARTCGEGGVQCIGAYFKRDGEQCTYRVIPDGEARGPYDVPVSSLMYEWRVRIYLQGRPSHSSFESQWQDQERFRLYNLRYPHRAQDPCRWGSTV